MDIGLYDLGEGGAAATRWARRHKAEKARRAGRTARRLQREADRAAGKSPQIVQMSGRWGRLTIIGISKRRTDLGGVFWWCRCNCGWVGEVRGSSIRYGQSKSCGCLSRELARHNFGEHRHKKKNRTGIRILFIIAFSLSASGRHEQARRLRANIRRLIREKRNAWGRDYQKKWRARKAEAHAHGCQGAKCIRSR